MLENESLLFRSLHFGGRQMLSQSCFFVPHNRIYSGYFKSENGLTQNIGWLASFPGRPETQAGMPRNQRSP